MGFKILLNWTRVLFLVMTVGLAMRVGLDVVGEDARDQATRTSVNAIILVVETDLESIAGLDPSINLKKKIPFPSSEEMAYCKVTLLAFS